MAGSSPQTRSVTVIGPDGLPSEERERLIARGLDWIEQEADRGATALRVHIRSYGPFGVLRRKQVGPPQWRYPKLLCELHRFENGRRVLNIGGGWRFTVYEFDIWLNRKKDEK